MCIIFMLQDFVARHQGHTWKRHLIFGFEENLGTENIIIGLTILLQRGTEWHHEAP